MKPMNTEPQHEYGYPESQLRALMDATTFKRFIAWMRGQTFTATDAGEAVYYAHDVRRFMAGKPIID